MTDLAAKHTRAAGGPDPDFREILKGLARTRSSTVGVFSDFCRIVACCLAMQTREDEYLERIKGYAKDELDQLARAMASLINEMEDKPFEDVLGVYYTEAIAGAGQQARGELYTPPSVSQMMSNMTVDADRVRAEGKPITVGDPCCGSGSMILTLAQTLKPDHHLIRATLQDINPVACDMAYINTTLWGIPTEVILGDTIQAECRSRWANVHWYRVGEDQRRQALKLLNLIRTSTPAPGSAPGIPEALQNPEATGPAYDGGASLPGGQPPSPAAGNASRENPASPGPHEQFGLF